MIAAFLLASLANFALAFFYCAAFFLLPLYLGTVRGQGSSHIGHQCHAVRAKRVFLAE